MRSAPPWFDDYIDGNGRNVRVEIAVGAQIDPTAAVDATVINTGQMPHSVPSQVFDGNIVSRRYALYSAGGWRTAPATTIITPDGQTSPQSGIVSDVISDSAGDIDWNLNLAFTKEHQSGLTIYFQEDMIAEDFDILVDDAVIQDSAGGGPTTPGTSQIVWSINSGVLNIWTSDLSALPIPDYAEGDAPWYPDRASITSLNVNFLVNGIGTNAFFGLSNLTNVQSMGSPIYISMGAFKGCTSLASVTIPASVGEVFGAAFDGCTSLASVTIQGTPQIYAGAFTLGNYNDLAECAMSGIVVNNAYGNRYTKLWQDTLGATVLTDTYDGCYRIYGSGVFTAPTTPPILNIAEMLVFDRVTSLTGATTIYNTWGDSVKIGTVFLGDSVATLDLNLQSWKSTTSLRNGDKIAKSLTRSFLNDAPLTSGSIALSNIGSAGTMARSGIRKIVLTAAINLSNFMSAFNGCNWVEELSGVNCEGDVLYSGNYYYFFAARPLTGIIKIREGTQRGGTVSTSLYINTTTLDFPSTINNNPTYVMFTGEVDTMIWRCNREFLVNVKVSARRIFSLKESSGTGSNNAGTAQTHQDDLKLEILDIIGGTSLTNRIWGNEFRGCINIQQLRVRGGAVSSYGSFYLNNSTPNRTYNAYTDSGVPYGGSNYTQFVRVGPPPPIEVT